MSNDYQCFEWLMWILWLLLLCRNVCHGWLDVRIDEDRIVHLFQIFYYVVALKHIEVHSCPYDYTYWLLIFENMYIGRHMSHVWFYWFVCGFVKVYIRTNIYLICNLHTDVHIFFYMYMIFIPTAGHDNRYHATLCHCPGANVFLSQSRDGWHSQLVIQPIFTWWFWFLVGVCPDQ